MANFTWLLILLIYPAHIMMEECPFYSCDKFFSTSLVCKHRSLGHVEYCNYTIGYTKFKDIVLSNLNITSLDRRVFYQMTKLTTLYLTNNSLETLDYRLFLKQKNLRYLDLNYNRLVYLDNRIFENQNKMTKLFLMGNRLTSLNSQLLVPLKSLMQLKLAGNPFVCGCSIRETMMWCEKMNLTTNATCENGISWSQFNFTENCLIMNSTEMYPSAKKWNISRDEGGTTQIYISGNNMFDEQAIIIIASSLSVFLISILLIIIRIYCRSRKSKTKERHITKEKENISEFLIPPTVTASLK